jgi:nitroreductase
MSYSGDEQRVGQRKKLHGKNFVLLFALIKFSFMNQPVSLSPAQLLSHLNWRYATKMFDPAKTISPEIWKALEETLVLTPSSCGLQPWKFIVITDKEMQAKLVPHSWDQKQVIECSHYVIFASQTKLNEADINRWIARIAEVRQTTVESLKGYRGMMVGELIQGPRSKAIAEWAAQQAYIALGNFMTAAALLQIDTCPMEGFVPQEYDRILGLPARGLTAAVCCAAGYRSANDKYAALPKVRYPAEEVIENI